MANYWLEIVIFLFAIYGLTAIIAEIFDAIRTRGKFGSKLTMIVKVSNQGDIIEGIIRQILKLKWQVGDFELIVIDGGSYDDTLPILKRLQGSQGNFLLFSEEHHKNVIAEIIQNCPSQVICYLDLAQDLELIKKPEKLGKIFKHIA